MCIAPPGTCPAPTSAACGEADFCTAEYDLAKGARDHARRLLQSAVDGCPAAAPEATFAHAELVRTTSAGQ